MNAIRLRFMELVSRMGGWRKIAITLIDRVLKPESKQFCYGRVRKLPIPNGRNGNQKV
jgi:hypothetical protein